MASSNQFDVALIYYSTNLDYCVKMARSSLRALIGGCRFQAAIITRQRKHILYPLSAALFYTLL